MRAFHLAFVSIVLTLLCISVPAQSKCLDAASPKLSDAGRSAVGSLEKETTFALGGVGYAGEMSSGEASMRVLLAEPAGEIALFKLSASDAGAGGLYGIAGLKILNSDCIGDAYKAYLGLPDKEPAKGRHEVIEPGDVGFMSGCLYTVRKRKELAKQISGAGFGSTR